MRKTVCYNMTGLTIAVIFKSEINTLATEECERTRIILIFKEGCAVFEAKREFRYNWETAERQFLKS